MKIVYTQSRFWSWNCNREILMRDLKNHRTGVFNIWRRCFPLHPLCPLTPLMLYILFLPQLTETSSRYARKISGTTALQEALKEKQQHIEQLLAERDLERAEMAKATSHISDVEKELNAMKSQHVQVTTRWNCQTVTTCDGDGADRDVFVLLATVRDGEWRNPPAGEGHVGQHAEGQTGTGQSAGRREEVRSPSVTLH